MRFFRSEQAARRTTDTNSRFEAALLPHLEAAYNLARWLMKNEQDAEDMVQDACLRALQAYSSFRGGNFRAYLLKIVRNTCYSRLKSAPDQNRVVLFDEEIHDSASDTPDPATILLRRFDAEQVRRAIEELPPEFREVLALREVEGMSYREIADVTAIPTGTVMSRLARARRRMASALTEVEKGGCL